MIDRAHIEQFLKVNGLGCDSPDDEIKSLLISARWHKDDVETALIVLREDPGSHEQHIDSMHAIFNSDQTLAPETLNSVLGMDVQVHSLSSNFKKNLENKYRKQKISIVVAAVFIAFVLMTVWMWFKEVGLFHI